jgi:hypothetical protein
MGVLWKNVDVSEEIFLHKIVVALRILRWHTAILIKIERHDVSKRDFA